MEFTLENKIEAFAKLGKFLNVAAQIHDDLPDSLHENEHLQKMRAMVEMSVSYNGWHTPKEVRRALKSWGEALTAKSLQDWLLDYDLKPHQPKTVALILAGNIPMVGFHDLLSVLITGNKALVKMSSNDSKLLPIAIDYLISVEPRFADRIIFTEGKLENFDAVIATGSNNTARYFEYYFRDKPSVLRKSRNSVAVLTGKESEQDLINLGEDIFAYFGLGCRSISKIFVPKDYDFQPLFKALYEYRDVVDYQKYANNYDYNKAVFLMSNFKLLDNEFLLLKEDSSHASPIGTLFFEYYNDLAILKNELAAQSDKIQCIVSSAIDDSVGFGQSQHPKLSDYADGVDTILFLQQLVH